MLFYLFIIVLKVSVDDSASSPPDQPEAVVVEYEDFIEVYDSYTCE